MKIGILRLNCEAFGKIGTYNVQELGLARALAPLCGKMPYVFYCNRDVSEPEVDSTYENVIYLPHKSIGVHGIIQTKLLDKYELDGLILFADNQLCQARVISYCKKRGIICVNLWGGVLSQSTSIIKKLYTIGILVKNWCSYRWSYNVCKTSAVAEKLLQYHIPFKKVIHVGLDDKELYSGGLEKTDIRELLGIGKNKSVFLFVGRMVANKRPLDALRIFEKWAAHYDETELIMIGDGIERIMVEEQIRKSLYADRIRLIPVVPYAEMYKYFISADVLLNLCDVEIFGMTILEAMYYGCIPVVKTAPGPIEYLKNGVNGYLCNTYDMNEWQAAISNAVKRNENVIKKARQVIEKDHLWSGIAAEYYQIFKEGVCTKNDRYMHCKL